MEKRCQNCRWFHVPRHSNDDLRGICEIPLDLVAMPLWVKLAFCEKASDRVMYKEMERCPTYEAHDGQG